MNCRVCTTKIKPFFSLGDMPLVNSFLTAKQIPREKKYDLTVGLCPKCFLVQLINVVPPKDLFRNYVYFSSISSSFLKHCHEISRRLNKRLKLGSKSLVLEIASNDGALLADFKKLGVQILGVDPAKNIAAVANKKGITTIPEFFSNQLAKKLKKENTQADLVYGGNVLAHVPEIVDFVDGVKTVLKERGTAVFEFPYIKGILENKFDTIYHEHVFYYSLTALVNLFNKVGLEIYDVEPTPMQGGSLLIYVSRPETFPVTIRVKNLLGEEIRLGYLRYATYKKMGERVARLKKNLHLLLNKLHKDGKSVAAYGAPAKGNILLNHFGIADKLSFIVDKSRAKQGLYTPGTHLKVHSLDAIDQKKPDYLLMLCWNIAEEVIKEQEAHNQRGGKFIIPIPKLTVI